VRAIYYSHWREGKKQIWKKIGKKPQATKSEMEWSDYPLKMKREGHPVKTVTEAQQGGPTAGETVSKYLEEYKLSGDQITGTRSEFPRDWEKRWERPPARFAHACWVQVKFYYVLRQCGRRLVSHE
jgi:hypothetical protein